MIAFSCGGCGKSYVVADDRAGRRSRCKACGAPITVPDPAPAGAYDFDPVAELPPRAPHEAEVKVEPKAKTGQPKRRRRAWWAVDRDAGVALGVGAAIAAVALSFWPVGMVVSTLLTVIHELGHSATSWLLGSPMLPSFDLTYGGGVSRGTSARQPLLIAAVCGWLGFALWRARGDRAEMLKWAAIAAIYAAAAFTPLRGVAIQAMGHGSELLFAGIFLYRALSGSAILRSEERPLYAALGFFILAHSIWFASSLITSADFRQEYGDAKGGGDWMDFSQVAASFGWSVQGVARLFLAACILTPAASFLALRWKRA